LKIKVDIDELQLDDLIELETPTLKYIKSFLARFLVDDNDKQIPEDEAFSIVGKMKLKELMGSIEQVTKAVSEAVDNAVPPRKSGS